MDVKNKRVTVVGFGRSGLAAARLLIRRQAVVTVTDLRPSSELEAPMAALKEGPIRYRLGGHPAEAFDDADLVVMSPGVSAETLQPVRLAAARGIPVIGEIELGFSFTTAPVVAITGTNGKSTTTALAGAILKEAGGEVFIGGNLGRPLCEAVLERSGGEGRPPWDWIVVEVSSFQLETIRSFRPRVAVLLNVTPNHLDRYRTMEDYRAAKWRLFENQTADDLAVINADDPVVFQQAASIRARRLLISRTPRPEEGVYLSSSAVVSIGAWTPSTRQEIIRQDEIPLRGSHNIENVLAASAVGIACGCPAGAVRKAVKEFKGLEHRLEAVRRRDSVLYVNDSKATTTVALAKALEAFCEPIVLIAGGRSKGGEFAFLRDLLRQRVKAAVLIGEARPILRAAWSGAVSMTEAGSLEEAVRLAAQTSAAGDVVLLSPACASFDMFRDFEDRGNRFKEIVNGL
ncbi:MAG: UDP-N-acetylmuramoyl-L-alanine--D-glutamate ligase [Nitrospirae bacterium]|nr:UDP-N-acetylmuramoyl-L-alanine--D-glutamate ligase [Nitrospirota bacterium]